ncbi:hypothetical protein Tco_0255389 [Tanacetum coccineum]
MLMNAIALLRLAIRSSEGKNDGTTRPETMLVLDKLVDEPLVLDEQLMQHMIVDELVLHMVVVVEQMCKIIEQLVKAIEESLKTVDDTEMDCTQVEDCCSIEVCYMYIADQSLTHAYSLLT